MSQIHILDKYTNKIKAVLSNRTDKKTILQDIHTRNIETHSETYDFIVDYSASEDIQNRDRVLIPDDELGNYREFIVDDIHTDTFDGETEIKAVASYLEDLKKAKPIAPQIIDQHTTQQAVEFALFDVAGWEAGDIEYAGFRSISWTSYNSPYDILKIISNRFDLQLDFTIETDGNRVSRRLVHLRQKTALFKGKEVRRGKDLENLKVQKNSTEVVTALLCLAPEPEEGQERVVTVVTDEEAQALYGKEREYIWGIYEPESEDADMTLERLTTLANTEIKKRNKIRIDYSIEAVSLEEFLGHEQVLLGDKIRLKDDLQEPYFYVEATVKEVKRSVFNKHNKTYVLGDIIEYTREDITKVFNQFKAQISKRLKETASNLDNIVTIVDEEVERRIFKQPTPPTNPVNDQLWLDTSNPEKPILKRYFNGDWNTEIKAVTEASDIDAITREQAMYESALSSFENLKVTHEQLLIESDKVKANAYLTQTHIDNINSNLQIIINTYNSVKNAIDSHNEEEAITLEDSNAIHQFMLSYSTAVAQLRTAIQDAIDYATEYLEYLQSQYTDEKYNDALNEVANKFGLVNDEGVLVGDVVLLSDLQNTKADLESQLETAKNTLNDMIDDITGDNRNLIIGTSLIDDAHYSVQGEHTVKEDEANEYIRFHQPSSQGEGENLLDVSNNTSGTRINLDGTIISDSSYTSSDFISVTPSSSYAWDTNNAYIESPRIIFYDENQNYLGGELHKDVEILNFTAPSNTHFIRVTAPTDVMDASSWTVTIRNASEVYVLFRNKADYVANETYTIAFDFRSSVVDELDNISLITNNETYTLHDKLDPTPINLDADGEWKRYYMQFTPTVDITQAQLKIGTDFTDDAVGEFDLRQIHLYKGTSVLSWQPAPEDNRQFITQLSREITKLEDKVSQKLTRDDYDILEGEINSVSTQVSQTASAVTTKADQSIVDTINDTVTNHGLTITEHAQGIDTLIQKTNTHDDEITTVTNQANETAEGLNQTITKVTEAEGKIEQAQLDIIENTEEISRKVGTAQYVLDQQGVISRLDTADTERIQLNNRISDRVTLTEYNSYKTQTGTLGDANKTLYLDHALKGKWLRLARNGSSDGTGGSRAYGRFIIADRTTSQHGTVEFISAVNYNNLTNSEFIVNSFSKMSSFPFTRARIATNNTYDAQYLDLYFDPTREDTNTVAVWLKDNIQQSGWTLLEMEEATVPSGYETMEFDINETASTKGILTKHGTDISQNGYNISLKADQSELDSVNNTLSQQYAELNIKSNEITGIVSGLSDDLTEVSTLASQTKDTFDLSIIENQNKFNEIDDTLDEKVDNDKIITSINLSQEGVAINGDKVDISAGSSIRIAIDNAEDNAKSHADTKAQEAENNAKAHAETKATEAQQAAEQHADAKAEAERAIAEAYADGKVSDEEQARINDANAKLQEAKTHADTKAQEAENAAKAVANSAMNKATTADGKANSANDKIDNLKLGGRNLLLKSGTPVTTSNYAINDYYLSEDIPEGTEVTISFKAKLGTGKSYFRLYNSGGNVSMGKNFYPANQGEYEVYTHTFNWVVGSSLNEFLRIYHMPSSPSSTSSIEWIQLETGNRATDWYYAPEDLVEKERLVAEINLSEEGVKIQGDKIDMSASSSIRLAIDGARDSAISTANQNATTKANTAKSEAIAEASTDATSKANSARNQAVEIAKGEVVGSSIVNENLIKYSDFWNNNDMFYYTHARSGGDAALSGTFIQPTFGKGWYKAMRATGSLTYIWTRNNGVNYFEVAEGNTYTFSVLVAQNTTSYLNYAYMRRDSDNMQMSLTSHLVSRTEVGEVYGRTVYKYVYTFESEFDADDAFLFFGFNNSTESQNGYYMSEWKLEAGNRATAYMESYVAKRNIISEINLNDQGVKIAGDKIDLIGDVSMVNGEVKVKHLTASSGDNDLSLTGSGMVMSNDLGQLDIGTSGIIYRNQLGDIRYRMDTVLVTSSAFGTSNANVYLAAQAGQEARVVDFRDIPGDGLIDSYRYLPMRAKGFYGDYLNANPAAPYNHLYIRPLGGMEVRITNSETTSTYANLRADGLYGNHLTNNSAEGQSSHIYIRPLSDGEIRVTSSGSTTSYRDVRARDIMVNSIYTNTNTNLYLRSDNEIRTTSHGSTSNYRDLRTGGVHLEAGWIQQHTSGNFYMGVAGGEFRVTNNNLYNGGNTVYRDIRFANWRAMSHEKYKYDIEEWNMNVLDILKEELQLYSFKIKGEAETENSLIHQGIVIRENSNDDQFPSEWREGDGFNGNKVIWWNTKAIQELAFENDELKIELNNVKSEMSAMQSAMQQEIEALKTLIEENINNG